MHEMSSFEEVRVGTQGGQAIAHHADSLRVSHRADWILPARELEPRAQLPVGDDCHPSNGAVPEGSMSQDVRYLSTPEHPFAGPEFFNLDPPIPAGVVIGVDVFDALGHETSEKV